MAKEATIKIRRSATAGKTPTTTDLALGELAINTYDGKLFLKKSVSNVESIVTFSSTVSYNDLTNIPQNLSTTASPTFAGATLNGPTDIKESGTGAQNTLTVAGAGTGSLFAVGVSDTAGDGINLKSLTSNSSNPAKLTLSGSSVVIASGPKQWEFTSTGNLKLPANGDIVDSTNTSVLKFPTVKRVTFDNFFIENNFTLVFNIDGTTNKITTSGPLSYAFKKNLAVNGVVTFFGPINHTEVGVANIVPYKSYYIKTLDIIANAADLGYDQPDPDTGAPSVYASSDAMICDITISETLGGSIVDLLDFHTEIYEEAIMLSTVSSTSYQEQRPPKHFQNYDENGNDIRGEMINATFGDTYFDSVSQHIFIYANSAGDGTPQRIDFTTGL